MAYVIGSQKGKNKAKGMKTGETYEASDGSVWTKEPDGSVTVRTSGNTYKNAYSPTSSGGGSSGGSKSGNSQYTGSSTSIKTNNTTQQSIKDKMNANSLAWWDADEEGRKQLEAENKSLAALLGGSVSYDAGSGTWSGTAEGTWEENYEEENQKPTEPTRDPRIDALLDEILNREDFSYDAMSDPLYQQYADMYRREGDRAMRDTLAEAAAGAGGMNTYAITAAQQANSYYNSQLNDKIPELYQLAYQIHLQDIESKVQDLGILQDMDTTQYNRYRDTITDWYADKNFAYGVYKDDVAQNNWQTEQDNYNYWKNKEFDYNDYWKNKEWDYNDYWKNKEYTDNRGDIDYDRKQNEKNEAYDKIVYYIENGVTSIDPALMEKAEMTQDEVNLLVTAIQSQLKSKGTSSGGSVSSKKKSVDVDDDDDDTPIDTTPTGGNDSPATLGSTLPAALPIHESIGNFQTIANACEKLLETKGKSAVLSYLNEVKTTGAIDLPSFTILLNKYSK